MRKVFYLVLTLLVAFSIGIFLGTIASGQVPTKNPTTVAFTPSVDHATIDKYVIGYFASGATVPNQQADLGKGTPNAQNEVSFPLPTYPIGAIYTAKVKAVQGAAESDWSTGSDPFQRTPAVPSRPIIR